MSTSVDPLRSTLDHLALDPRARSDRPYLITMLRRLGYSEAEIAAYLGEATPTPGPEPEPTPEPAPEPLPEPRAPLPDDSDERLIEVEYTGPGLRDFQLVVPVDATEFDLDDPLGLGAGLEAGQEVLEGDPDSDELDAFLSGEGAVDFDAEFADDDDIPIAESDAENPEMAVREDGDLGDDLGFDDDGELEPVDEEGLASMEPRGDDDDEFDEDMDPNNPVGEGLAGKVSDPDAIPGIKLKSFTSRPVHQAKVRRLTAEERAALAAQDSLDEAVGQGWQPAEAPTEAAALPEEPTGGAEGLDSAWDEPEESESWPGEDEEPFMHGDWILHSREQQRADGSWHRVYFFAKGRSPNGEPSPMPEGYGVGVNERTGLPYLRRASSPEPEAVPEPPTTNIVPEADPEAPAPEGPKTRVKMRRVTAESADQAEEELRKEGRKVLGSMPVDIKEHDEDEEP